MGRWSFRKIKKGKMLKIVVDRNIEKSKHFFEKKKKKTKSIIPIRHKINIIDTLFYSNYK